MDPKSLKILGGGLTVADPTAGPGGDEAARDFFQGTDFAFGVTGAAPPNPDRLAKKCAVGESNHRAQAHFIGNERFGAKLQKMPDVAGRDMEVEIVENLALLLAFEGNVPAPSFDDGGVGERFFEFGPRIAIAFFSAVEDRELKLSGERGIIGNARRRKRVDENDDF